jgi:threonine dehydratase
MHRLSLTNISEAARAIDPVFLNTPQYISERLSAKFGCELTLKIETINPIGCFKGRGASYWMHRFQASGQRADQAVCASAGNFGQALAYVCRTHQIPLTVFASIHANPLKIEKMSSLGVTVHLAGEDFDAAKEAAAQFAQQTGALLIEDGRVPEIAEGAGTIAVELLARLTPEAILIPLGNGALLTGMARWIKSASPGTKVIGVSSIHAPAMHESWKTGQIIETKDVNTIADGIAVRIPIPEAVADMQGIVDDVLLVSDPSIRIAMRQLFEEERLIVEPAGAAGIAALVEHPEMTGKIATVICGGNLTQHQIRTWLLSS